MHKFLPECCKCGYAFMADIAMLLGSSSLLILIITTWYQN